MATGSGAMERLAITSNHQMEGAVGKYKVLVISDSSAAAAFVVAAADVAWVAL